jgi:hypothetical protein
MPPQCHVKLLFHATSQVSPQCPCNIYPKLSSIPQMCQAYGSVLGIANVGHIWLVCSFHQPFSGLFATCKPAYRSFKCSETHNSGVVFTVQSSSPTRCVVGPVFIHFLPLALFAVYYKSATHRHYLSDLLQWDGDSRDPLEFAMHQSLQYGYFPV